MVLDVMISQKKSTIFEQKYQKDPGMNRVKVTVNIAEHGSQRSEQPQNVKIEPIKRGLKLIF